MQGWSSPLDGEDRCMKIILKNKTTVLKVTTDLLLAKPSGRFFLFFFFTVVSCWLILSPLKFLPNFSRYQSLLLYILLLWCISFAGFSFPTFSPLPKFLMSPKLFVLNYIHPQKSAHNIFIYHLQTTITKASTVAQNFHRANCFLHLRNGRSYHLMIPLPMEKTVGIVLDAFFVPQIQLLTTNCQFYLLTFPPVHCTAPALHEIPSWWMKPTPKNPLHSHALLAKLLARVGVQWCKSMPWHLLLPPEVSSLLWDNI